MKGPKRSTKTLWGFLADEVATGTEAGIVGLVEMSVTGRGLVQGALPLPTRGVEVEAGAEVAAAPEAGQVHQTRLALGQGPDLVPVLLQGALLQAARLASIRTTTPLVPVVTRC